MRNDPSISPARLLNQLHRLWATFRRSSNVEYHRDGDINEDDDSDSSDTDSVDYPDDFDAPNTNLHDLEIVFDDWDLDEDASDAATAA
jgi:hypothetical protein